MTEQRFCPTCGERIPNDPEQHFCMFCGSFCMSSGGQANQPAPDEAGAYIAKKINFCPYCRAEIVTGLKYCGSCGKMLPKAANTHAVMEQPKIVAPPPSTPKAEELLPEPDELLPEPDVTPQEPDVLPPEPDVPQPKVVPPAPPYTPLPQRKNNTLLILAVSAIAFVGLAFVALLAFVVAVGIREESRDTSYEYAAKENYTPGYEEVEAEQCDSCVYEETAEAVDDSDWRTQYDFVCERIVTESDLVGLNSTDLRIMRNWIFARHGYIFRTQELKDYFSQYPWYNPRYTDVSSMLSSVEIKNADFIKRHE